MSIRHRIQRNLQVVHTLIDGQTDSVDLRVYLGQLKDDPEFDGAFDHMIEFSKLDPLSDDSVPALALSHLVPPIDRVQMAIVAPGDLEFGIGRRFQAIYELPDDVFAVSRDQKRALAWFGLEDNMVGWGGWRTVLLG